MPVFNAENELKTSLNSVINQTMDLKDIQVIMVNDCSTDNSAKIINKYANEYDNFIAIHLKENIGGAYGPRNIGLKKATGEYIMFLDSDDKYTHSACETLYTKISKNNVDIVFGRYLRVYPSENAIYKSYSPFEDDINDYEDDIVGKPNLSGIVNFIWTNFFNKVFYGKKIKKKFSDEICIKSIYDDPSILKILPSIWTKIYKRDIIEKNNIEFPDVISGEDLNFVMKYYLNSEKILFLNNNIIYDYYMRDSPENQSVTKKISFRLVFDSLKGYTLCSQLCDEYEFKQKDLILNPFLLHWIQLFLKFNGSRKNSESFLKQAQQMKKTNITGIKNKIIIFLIISMIKISINYKIIMKIFEDKT
jgi:glycosyltransferase involved in cell wall biosynthesis